MTLSEGTALQDPVGAVAGRVREAQLFCCYAVTPRQSQQVSWSGRGKTVRITILRMSHEHLVIVLYASDIQ